MVLRRIANLQIDDSEVTRVNCTEEFVGGKNVENAFTDYLTAPSRL
jgi:hypothetical protein